jgi:hypothetical protein
VELRIGVVQQARELEIDLPDDTDRDQLLSDLKGALGKGDGVLELVDRRGRRVLVSVARVAWVELAPGGGDRRVGFGAG